MAKRASTSTADSLEQQIRYKHNCMVISLSEHFNPALKNWDDLLELLSNVLRPVDLHGKDTNFFRICDELMANGTISYGSYDKLYKVIRSIDVTSAWIIQRTSNEIKDIVSKGQSEPKPSRTEEGDQGKGGNDLPAEILQMDPYSIQLYQKCLEEKEEADYRLRLIVIGQTEVGKTTLTRNLLRLPRIIPPESAMSTDGVDIHYCFVNLHDNDWITVATDMQHAGQSLNARLIQSLKSTTSNERAEPKIDGESSDQTSLTSEDGSFSAGEFDNDTPVGDLVLETVKNLVMSQKVPSGDFDYTKLGELSVWDFAGQFVFYTTHHTFLTHRAVYLLVTRLDQNINDTVDKDQCFLDATGCKKMKIKDFVSYWMNSVHLYSGAAEHLPPVILVGTHLDKVESTMADRFTDNASVRKCHVGMVQSLSSWIYPGDGGKWEEFQNQMTLHLGHDKVYGVTQNSMTKICQCLMDKRVIGYGEYTVLRAAFIDIGRVQAAEVIDEALKEMESLR